MKKRLFSLMLAVSLAVTALVLPASAADGVRFSDVTDKDTAMAVESLRLLGVLDGYGDGSFRPGTVLTRAQFCKMAVYAMNGASELGQYSTVTVFPDVKPSHWASSYINMAAKGKAVIAGYADGRFHPDNTVTVGQAVTILLRLLGYKDENVGGIWPHSYMAVGRTIGLTDGVGADGFAPLTRGQAARLFLNLLRAEKNGGGSYLSTLGTTVPNVMLVSSSATGPDGRNNALQTTERSDPYQLASGKISNGLLNGCKGTLVLNKNGQALTFVPDATGSSRVITLASKTATQIVDTNGVKYTIQSGTKAFYNGKVESWGDVYAWLHAGTSVTLYLDEAGGVDYVFVGGSEATSAVIVSEDGSAAGFDALTGGVSGYSIYKNGAPAGLGDLRRYDVAVYDPASNAIRVCDTRVTVYYDSCYPNPDEPSEITALGNTTFEVLPTAMESVSQFKPGDQMTLLLTESGQVAGAVEASGNSARGNAVGVVREDGSVQMLCGTAKISLKSDEADAFKGQLVRISSGRAGSVNLRKLTGGASGDLDVSGRKLGSKDLAENVMVFRGGEDISLSQLTENRVPASQIVYARTNWAGQVDLLVLSGSKTGSVIYGRAVVNERDSADENSERTIEVVYGDKTTKPLPSGYQVRTGDYVAVTLNRNNSGFSSLNVLTELKNVSNSAWNGQTAVTVGGRTYTVPRDVLCYNKTAGTWLTLSQAHGYADSANLFVSDGVVRVIEIR